MGRELAQIMRQFGVRGNSGRMDLLLLNWRRLEEVGLNPVIWRHHLAGSGRRWIECVRAITQGCSNWSRSGAILTMLANPVLALRMV